MDEVELRILNAAIELAEQGGFDALRQRDLAARAEVALGTLYSRFRSKELVLVAALRLEAAALERELQRVPISGRTPQARLNVFFTRTTQRFVSKPHLARAILRAAASGDPECTRTLMQYQLQLTVLAAEALRGRSRKPRYSVESAQQVATVLIMVWFANLVGWSGGVATPEIVVGVVDHATRLLLHGAK
jgi:TetR/AcrR family transcriptional regulator, cholesterol catabolism regulator